MKQPITNKDLKRRIIEISYKHKLSHLGSCLTAVDIIKEIYDIKKSGEPFVLSAGHAHLAHIVVKEWFGEWLFTKHGTPEEAIEKYGIHCDRQAGCDVSTGSLGQGLPIAVGMALADRSKNVYCLISDGECSEGSIAEALRIKNNYEVYNLKIYLNDNGYGAYRKTDDDIKVTDLYMINYRPTNMNDWPAWLQGQEAHYHVMNKEEYKQALKILA